MKRALQQQAPQCSSSTNKPLVTTVSRKSDGIYSTMPKFLLAHPSAVTQCKEKPSQASHSSQK